MREIPPTASANQGPAILASPGFTDWLADIGCCLVLSTYQAGRIIFVGLRPDGTLRAHERIVEQCQGIWTDGQSIWASGKTMLWRFVNTLPKGMVTQSSADRVFVPREARVTGRLDIHDIGLGRLADMAVPGPIFVNTLYSCLATISETAAFRPLWRPSFISALLAEDRCHMNGLAMDGERPAYVTAISRSDLADGWRERRNDGGIVIDVTSGEIVTAGLSMPHSPRLQGGKLWVLNSGRGELGFVDPKDGRFTAICFCPGYARGLAFVAGGRWAVVGLSRPRHNQTFEGLELQDSLIAKDTQPRCGILVVDTLTGRSAHWLRFTHSIHELYDVAIIQGARQAEAISLKGEYLEGMVQPEGPP
jgi:uncharacterized protein (TIGR03032 family)